MTDCRKNKDGRSVQLQNIRNRVSSNSKATGTPQKRKPTQGLWNKSDGNRARPYGPGSTMRASVL